MSWQSAAKAKLVLIYSIITVLGILIGITFLVYFFLRFSLLFVLIGFIYLLAGIGSAVYPERKVKES